MIVLQILRQKDKPNAAVQGQSPGRGKTILGLLHLVCHNGFEIECMNIIKEGNFKPIGVLRPPLPI